MPLFYASALTEEEVAVLMTALDYCHIDDYRPRHCFFNAQMLALADPQSKLVYHEGIANRRVPVHHAWLVLDNKVIDLTWRTPYVNHQGVLGDAIFGWFPSHWTYEGQPFSRREVWSSCRGGVCGPMRL